jgi:hypothetical protein
MLKSFNLTKNLLLWWILVWMQVAGLFIAYQSNVLAMIWKEDITKLSVLILLIHVFMTIKVGMELKSKSGKWLKAIWLSPELTFAVGILGTLIGLILMMHEATVAGIPTTPQAIQKMLGSMVGGMTTAFWVSACAISSTIIQAVQAMNLTMALQDEQ